MGKKKSNDKISNPSSDQALNSNDAADEKDSISSFEKINLHSEPPSERGSPIASEQHAAPTTTNPASTAMEEEIVPIEEEEEEEEEDMHTKPNKPENASPSGRSLDPVVRELEEAAAVAAAAATEAAAATKQKFLEGADKAKAFMSSFWSAFDDPTMSAAKDQQSEAALRQRLGLEENEVVLEVFRCKIIQSYAPNKNNFTAVKNIAFSGQLHVATGHVCFELDGAGGASAPISISKKELIGVIREGDALRIGLSGDRELILGAFSLPRLEVESALALVQSLVDSNSG
jgi:hypothetical protein